MAANRFRRELEALAFAFNSSPQITANVTGAGIINDFSLVTQYYRMSQQRRYLLWALLIGRSVDSFTKFFLDQKGCPLPRGTDDFNQRILRICDPSQLKVRALRTLPPLTSDLTIQTDLHGVRIKRNDIFHHAGTHFTPQQMQEFIFQTYRSLQQLMIDL